MWVANIPFTLMRMAVLVSNHPQKGIFKKLKLFWTFLRLYIAGRRNQNSSHVFQTQIMGKPMKFLGADMAFYLFREIIIRNEYQFEASTTAPKIMDCGANVGMAVMYFKSLFPDAEIHAFEANDVAFDLLKHNVAKNKLSDVHLHYGALCNQEGHLSFFKNEDPTSLLASIRSDRGGTKTQKVPAIKLSEHLKDTHVDFLKMDVEGAEWEILENLIEADCLQNVDQYIIEFHHQIHGEKSELARFLRPFEEKGFLYNIRPSFIEEDGYQNVVIHFYKEKSQCVVDGEMW